ncbi:MAG: maltose alpha-D-glucosyltransferase [Gemmatimonadota bacterium]|nr:maltose alpha-D-glucosyltransferase [Gemmatimonadota bacterium]
MKREPLWYKDAVIYQLHVRAFKDSDDNGIGDFRGLTQQLDYIRDLGVTAVWLQPFYPSPLRDDGYDIADYTDVNPIYGTLNDFKLFLREAHRRDLRVITELVMNHTSDQHAWFQRARRAKPGSRERDFYVWSDTAQEYAEARVIFKDFEPSNWTWDPVAGAYYWHRFYSHQPDLNFRNPAVHRAMFDVLDFWLGMGVDGLRLDAVPYLYETEGTTCENLPETHAFLRELRRHVDEKFKDRMLLAEANQWPEDAVAYFGRSDECHMAFHFPVMPRLFMALHMEDRFPVVDIMQQTPEPPEGGQWAIFLRNHDELTLEMVTDEDRDYMYRAYAQDPRMRINVGIRRRLAPLLGHARRRIELMNALLFSLPGTPIIYYGDEIGMGDNIYLGDRNGVRTPMQWSADRNAGFSRANPQQLYSPVIIDPEYHYEAWNVEAQQANPHSELWWMKRLIALRKQFRGFGRGSIEFLNPDNRRVLVFLRRFEGQIMLVVANLSRYVQAVELDLSEFNGLVPVEAFARTPFPPVGALPYFLTLGPHGFYWFLLDQPRAPARERTRPSLAVDRDWKALFDDEAVAGLEAVLPEYLAQRRWFGGKSRTLKSARIVERIPFPYADTDAAIAFVECAYTEGAPERYLLPLAFATDPRRYAVADASPHAVVADLHVRTADDSPADGVLFDALADERFVEALLEFAGGRRTRRGLHGALGASRTRRFASLTAAKRPLHPQPVRREQSNTSVVFGDQLILKLFRKVEEGINPDVEVERFLTEQANYPHTPDVAAVFEYRRPGREPVVAGFLQQLVPHEGDAWTLTVDALGRYFDDALSHPGRPAEPPPPRTHPLDLAGAVPPAPLDGLLHEFLDRARLLGRRTAELHLALASRPEVPAFAPEPFTSYYQRELYQGARSLARRTLAHLRARLRDLSAEGDRARARELVRLEDELLGRFKRIVDRKLSAQRIRVHGDYHLGQVLFTGRDFVIIDFEGEPARTMSERRFKHSPLRDVAGMLRSFDYAASYALHGGRVRTEDVARLRPAAAHWALWVQAAFLADYLATAGPSGLLPRALPDVRLLLDFSVLDKAIYELGYELDHRPAWVHVPVDGLLRLLGTDGAAG